MQGKGVLEDFDIVKAAGGPRRCIVAEFDEVGVGDVLRIDFKQKSDKKKKTLLCGIEIIAQK